MSVQILTFVVEVREPVVDDLWTVVGKQIGPTHEYKETEPQTSRVREQAIMYALTELALQTQRAVPK